MSQVVTGLERFLRDGPACAELSAGARLGLLAHPASVDSRARHASALLAAMSECRLRRLFAPEHGFWGQQQDMESVARSADPRTGLAVVSLYGASAATLKPAAADMEGLDAIIVDLQDVGSRYYTYVYTLSHVMEAAADAAIAVVVLDRPNPIGGLAVEGPVLETALASFVGRYPVAVRHGMTVGELATAFNVGFGIGSDLRVVRMEGWQRAAYFEDTGLPWVPPSPNMPSPSTAVVYPGACLIEGTNLSEGRGTTTPFELVGAPWLDGEEIERALSREELPGVLFRRASFRPMFQKHAGSPCGGVQVIVTDRSRFRPFETYLAIISAARRSCPERFEWRAEAYEFESGRLAIDLLLGRADLRPMLERGAGLSEMAATWRRDLEDFGRLRSRFLLYG